MIVFSAQKNFQAVLLVIRNSQTHVKLAKQDILSSLTVNVENARTLCRIATNAQVQILAQNAKPRIFTSPQLLGKTSVNFATR